MMLENSYDRAVLPVGRRRPDPDDRRVGSPELIQFRSGEPGLKHGQ
ncbi:MAG: hypothetical protein JWR70_638 [Modestobacter sp.]|jgi:hypothetical protein|nr:hypothetical protein [Modestobacter sp.]